MPCDELIWSSEAIEMVIVRSYAEQLCGRYLMMLFKFEAFCERQGRRCGASKQGLSKGLH